MSKTTFVSLVGVAAAASCTGTDDFPATPACYGSNVLGQEDVVIQIESFASGSGQLNFKGTGAAELSCESAFTKDDSNKIAFDNCDVSAYAKIKGAQYCSDADTLKATFNPLGVPLPVSVQLPRIDCPSSVSAATAQCTADDQSKIQALDDNAFGDKSNKCGKGALSLSGIDHAKFKSCMTSEVGISDACGECYATTADYGFKNCKAACLLGWCKQGCLDCTAPAQTDLPACTGIPAGSPTPCLESSAAQCTADDQSKIQAMDDNTFGDKSNKCGKGALSLSGINHDKFKSCMTTEVGISDSCGECYAVTADYGFKNCKSACLLGWCKEGCLSCTAPAQADLPACSGIPAGSPTPCMDKFLA